MANDKKIESVAEYITERGITVWNTKGGTIVSDGNTGQERFQISHPSGANLNFNNQTVSLFAPNNQQELIHGNKFSTTAGDAFSTTISNKEERVHGDWTVITGTQKFFSSPIADNWIAAHQDIAAAKAAPEHTYEAIGNNTDTVYKEEGTPEKGSGAVQGGSYKPSPAHQDIPALLEAKAGDIAMIEREMGVGGSIKLMSTKHLYLQAGTKAITFDSGVIVPKGKSVTCRIVPKDGKLEEVKMAVPIYENKDTSSAVPFGDVYISAGSKFNINSGSGGISIKSAGEVNLNSTGRLMLGGAEVAIGGSTSGGYGRVTIKTDKDVFIQSDVILTMVAPDINLIAGQQITYKTPEAVYTGNLHVQGNLIVEGSIHATGDIVAGAGGSNISLLHHKHGGVSTGGGSTSKPI
jgi:hypothetical protein